jgi:glutamate--cysteine ligase catalytic subunit
MGLLSLGTPLDWPETKKLANHIRHHGITQFLYTWDRWVGKKGEPLLWGDEVGFSLGVRSANPRRISDPLLSLDLLNARWVIVQIEYMVISLDEMNRRALLSLRQSEILEELQSVVLDLCNDQPEQR